LVSHNALLVAPGAAHVVRALFFILSFPMLTFLFPQIELANGRLAFSGTSAAYLESDSFKAVSGGDDKDLPAEETTSPKKLTKPLPEPSASPKKPFHKSFAAVVAESSTPTSAASSTEVSSASEDEEDSDSDEQDPIIDGPSSSSGAPPAAGASQEPRKNPRKLIEEEGRAVGHVDRAVWTTYFSMMGGGGEGKTVVPVVVFWAVFAAFFAGAKLTDVAQTFWLGEWAGGGALFFRSLLSPFTDVP
jgi:hypothetical protein